MTEETRRTGRAVGPPTIQTLTMPDGSRRMVLSRPVLGCEKQAFEWITLLAGENPDKWWDLRDLYRFITGGEPFGRISSSQRRELIKLLARVKKVALAQALPVAVVTKGDPISHFKLSNMRELEDVKLVRDSAAKDRSMELHFGKKARIAAEDILRVEVETLDEVNAQRSVNEATRS